MRVWSFKNVLCIRCRKAGIMSSWIWGRMRPAIWRQDSARRKWRGRNRAAVRVCYVIRDAETEMEEDAAAGLYPVPVYEPGDAGDNRAASGRDGFFYASVLEQWKEYSGCGGERERFFGGTDIQDQYNRRSSIAYALSLKYKLHSVGIDGGRSAESGGGCLRIRS